MGRAAEHAGAGVRRLAGAVNAGHVLETQADGRVHIALPPWSLVLLGLA